MANKSRITLVIGILLLFLQFGAAIAQGSGDYPRRPKLVLIIVIDQMRYDYLVRFRTRFAQGGFNRLLSGGANFADCRYDYATTITGPGHATLLTGTYSNIHGIIGNEWYDRSNHRMVSCVEDSATMLVSGPDRTDESRGSSPHYLIGSTLGDELRAATDFRSKVVSIALKDRAAILMGGHSPTAAYWYDHGSGRFVTSTYYMAALPAWVATFNRNKPVKEYCGRNWTALPGTSEGESRQFSLFNASSDEPCPDAKFMDWLERTPYMTEIELSFAAEAVKGEHLGQGPDTDLLAVSLSENDYIGHAFGPYSPQVVDVTLRTDRYLASFFTALDKLVGLKNIWIALSADHGVAPNPEFIQGHKWGLGTAKPSLIRRAVENAMAAEFGPGGWVVGASGPYFYLDSDALQKHHIDVPQAEEVAATAAASVAGVTAAFTRAQFLTGSLPSSSLGRKALNSFNPKRGGDVFIVLDPYALPVSGSDQTTHGSAWSYDSQVPLLLWGSAFRPGVYFDQCQPIDLAATLAATLGLVQPSGSQGRPLASAIR
jgi:predicted AlkP superfamily pyrophosphatase or phosphodiesterase